jgi:hypothetical protein
MALIVTKELFASTRNGFTPDVATKKQLFYLASTKLLLQLALELKLTSEDFVIRSNAGTKSASGELTLHGDSIFVQLYESFGHRGVGILYRRCKSRNDFIGGVTRGCIINDSNTKRLETFVRECKSMVRGYVNA